MNLKQAKSVEVGQFVFDKTSQMTGHVKSKELHRQELIMEFVIETFPPPRIGKLTEWRAIHTVVEAVLN